MAGGAHQDGVGAHQPVPDQQEGLPGALQGAPGAYQVPVHLLNWSPGHLVTWSSGHLVSCSPDHLITRFSRKFVHLDIQIIVAGPSRGHDVKYYQQYLEHLYQQVYK